MSSIQNMDVKKLLAPKSNEELEAMARAAHALTVQRFGKTIKLYAPVYVSNSCVNGCLYCGFANKNPIRRRTLTVCEAIAEADVIMARGMRHILIVAGEDPTNVTLKYLEDIARNLRPKVASLSIEVQPFGLEGYKRLANAGVDGITLYQETYNEETYRMMHPYGPKQSFHSRLDAIDAAGRAGMRTLGIGALLGLSDWRQELFSLTHHAKALIKRHWQSTVNISVPRIRNRTFDMPCPVSDRDLLQMIIVLRLSLPDSGIVLSTRESAGLRDKLLPLGITQMSAGSVTRPGGYSQEIETGEQFHLEDTRSPGEVASMLTKAGYDPVWKDWDRLLS